VPGKDYTFGRLIGAQSAGDARVLAEHGRPVLRLHLTDLDAGLTVVRQALG
jgi:glucose-6-phosphate isomerase